MSAAPPTHTETGTTAKEFNEFDYVVVGGGTAGLACAARLSEDPDVTIGVIEAGLWRKDDPKINYPAFIGQSLMDPDCTDYDWCIETVPQEKSNGRKFAWPRGKVLGGSSALNFLVWQRGYKGEYDDFGKLGNAGWGWKDFERFCKSSATMHPPHTELQKANFATYEKDSHGTHGPVQTSFSAWYTDAQKPFFEALKALGLNHNVDGLRGENSGIWASPVTLDPKTWVRSYAANAYYAPNASRKNLKVVTGALATKIELEGNSSKGPLNATGVHFDVDGESFFVRARKEVIVSGGSVKSPQLLELSGIGGKDVLEKAGVPVKIDNPNVGENLQEHIYCTSSYQLKPGFTTWDKMRNADFAKAAMEQYHGEGEDRGIVASAFSGFAYCSLSQYMTPEEIQSVKDEVNKADWSKYSKGVQEGIKLQLQQIDDKEVPAMDIFAPGYFATASAPKEDTEYFSILSALQHPFSRGSIHIGSSDPNANPIVDPKYYSINADLKILAKAVKYCDKITTSPHMRDIIVARQDPAPEKYKTEEDFEEFTKDFAVTEYHHVGTCSMMPKDKGGVVSERLIVHGTSNLRVVDASIMPLHVSSHIVSAVYAIGEKAAHMIQEDDLSSGVKQANL